MKIRHNHLKSETVQTRYGEAKLDSLGIVTNLEDLSGTPDQVLEHCPGFLDADKFPPKVPSLPGRVKPTEPNPPPAGTSNESKASDDKVAEVIKKLLEGGAPVTTEGYIDMTALNEELRAQNLSIISGTKRIEISDKKGLKVDPKTGKLQGMPTKEA